MSNYLRDWNTLTRGKNHYARMNLVWDNGNGAHSHFDSKEELLKSIEHSIKFFLELKKKVENDKLEEYEY